jgi:hypothetical protein
VPGHPKPCFPAERRRERPAQLDRSKLGPDLVDLPAEARHTPVRRDGPRLDGPQELGSAQGEQGRQGFVCDGCCPVKAKEATAGTLQAREWLDDHVMDRRSRP